MSNIDIEKNDLKKRTPRIYQQMFLSIWALYSFLSMLFGSELKNTYDLSSYDSTLRLLVIIMLFLLFLTRRKFSYKFFVLSVLLAILIVLVEMTNLNKYFLVYILFIINARDIDFAKFIKFDFKVKIFTFGAIVFLCLIGVTKNYTSNVFYNGVTKSAYGFAHPNTFTCFALAILLEWLLIRYQKMKLYEWIANFAIFFVVFNIGGGRSSAYAYMIVYALFILARLRPEIFTYKPVKTIFYFMTPLMAVLSFLGVYLYSIGNAFMRSVDTIFTGRFYAANMFIVRYGINLFGHNLEMVGSRDAANLSIAAQILDNAYVKCLLMYGLVVLILVVFAYIVLFIGLFKKNQIGLALIALFYVVIGLGESYMLDPLFNISLIFLLNLNGIEFVDINNGRKHVGRRIKFVRR